MLAILLACVCVALPVRADYVAGREVQQAAMVPDSVRQVGIFIYLADVDEINSSAQTFLADVFIAARWHDPTLAQAGSGMRTLPRATVWSPNLLVVNRRNATNVLPDVVRVDADGNVQYVMRLTGDFTATMDLRAFPRDRQRFHVWVIAPHLGSYRVELFPDPWVDGLKSDTLTISDWSLSDMQLRAQEYRLTPGSTPLPGVTLDFAGQRRLNYYVVSVLLPLIAIVMMSWTVFWIDPLVVPTRVGVVVSTMLTMIAYRFMLGTLVPRLSYLTRLDYFMQWSTILVILTLFTMAAANYLKIRGRHDIVGTIDRIGRVAFPLVLALLTLVFWVL